MGLVLIYSLYIYIAKFQKMNLHEYQGKSILNSFGVATQRGTVVDKVEHAVAEDKKLTAETGRGW